MNTRLKIRKTWDNPSGVLVIGSFDPLLAAHAERLETLRKQHTEPLVVAIIDPAEPLLDQQARMELVAALRVVDFVMPHTPELEGAFPWVAVYNDTALHAQWCAEFKEHVLRRNQ